MTMAIIMIIIIIMMIIIIITIIIIIIIIIILKIIIITILIGSDKCRLCSFAKNKNQRFVACFFEPGQTKQLITLIGVFYYA